MLEVDYSYSGKHYKLPLYNTLTEKDLLLLGTVGAGSIDQILLACSVPKEIIDSLTPEEKMAMSLKIRSISVGDEVNVTFTCAKCSQISDNTINIADIVQNSNITNTDIIDAYKIVTDENIHEFTKLNIDEIDVSDYDDFKQEIISSVTNFNFVKPVICQRCGTQNHYDTNNEAFVISNMSDDTLMSMYQVYSDMVFYAGYTKLCIDTMYPFERSILFSLLDKTKMELAK